ncbi:hypothetical protein SNE40_022616 [Patella caerulea]
MSYPRIVPSSIDTPAIYLRSTSANVLTDAHCRGMLPTAYYWPGENKLSFGIPDANSQQFYDNRIVDERDDRTKKRRSPSLAQRRAANVRERRRMLNLNEAFDVLRRSVPTFNYERRLSRIETLRLAMGYISFMTQILNGKDSKDARVNIVKTPVKVKMDKELQENVKNSE